MFTITDFEPKNLLEHRRIGFVARWHRDELLDIDINY